MKSGPVTPSDIARSQRPALSLYSTWQKFHHGPRKSSRPLLANLARYPNAVLVAGCQRSGTTILTRVIADSTEFRGLSLTKDDELDAALALCGEIELPRDTRYCFQTTYLNERFLDYRLMGPGQKLIWVLRNPESVVYSMVYNWRRFALNELYEGCGLQFVHEQRQRRYRLPWPFGPSRIEKACHSYCGKTLQLQSIKKLIPPEQLLVIDYDSLIQEPHEWLRAVFAFIGAEFQFHYASQLKTSSLAKREQLPGSARRIVASRADGIYHESLALVPELKSARDKS